VLAALGTILSLPAFFFYFSGNALKSENLDVKSFFSSFTLGNLGYCKLISQLTLYLKPTMLATQGK
jgi:hypothetical protein